MAQTLWVGRAWAKIVLSEFLASSHDKPLLHDSLYFIELTHTQLKIGESLDSLIFRGLIFALHARSLFLTDHDNPVFDKVYKGIKTGQFETLKIYIMHLC